MEWVSRMMLYFYGHDLDGDYEFISLLKDITEEQAKEIIGDVNGMDFGDPRLYLYIKVFHENNIDTSLNWLLLKKI